MALTPEVVLTRAPVEISASFQMLNCCFLDRRTQWNFCRLRAVTADPRFQGGAVKPVTVNILVEISSSFQMFAYVFTMLTDTAVGSSIGRPRKQHFRIYNVVDLSSATLAQTTSGFWRRMSRGTVASILIVSANLWNIGSALGTAPISQLIPQFILLSIWGTPS
jgi:hypothetical protein